MSDEPAVPDEAPSRARVEPSRRRGVDLLPLLYLLGFLVLAGTLFYLYRHPPAAQLAPQEAGRVNTLQAQVEELRDQVAALQSRPAAASPAPAGVDNVAALQQRVAALEGRPAAEGGGQAAPARGTELADRVQKLEARPAPDLGPLTARIDALAQRPPVDLGPVNSRIDQLAAQGRDAAAKIGQRLDAIEARIGAVENEAKQTGASLEQRIASVDAEAKQTAAALGYVRQKAELAGRLQRAAAALTAGQKLGDIPGAPPALARFSSEAPPTEAGLRLSFDKYAQAAEKASQPAIMDNQDFGTRLWNRAQQVVTVRQGDRVLLGDPVAGVITHAREQLDAGDLEGAVRGLDGLAGPAKAAFQPWIDQARALLDARAAIASMAAR
jgi:hypothetical protein